MNNFNINQIFEHQRRFIINFAKKFLLGYDKNNIIKEDIVADGNCFYNSFNYALGNCSEEPEYRCIMNVRHDIYQEIINKLIFNKKLTPQTLEFNKNSNGITVTLQELYTQQKNKEYTDTPILFQAAQLYNIIIIVLNIGENNIDIIYPTVFLDTINKQKLNTDLDNVQLNNINKNNSVFLIKEGAHFITYKRNNKTTVKGSDAFYNLLIRNLNTKREYLLYNEHFNIINIQLTIDKFNMNNYVEEYKNNLNLYPVNVNNYIRTYKSNLYPVNVNEYAKQHYPELNLQKPNYLAQAQNAPINNMLAIQALEKSQKPNYLAKAQNANIDNMLAIEALKKSEQQKLVVLPKTERRLPTFKSNSKNNKTLKASHSGSASHNVPQKPISYKKPTNIKFNNLRAPQGINTFRKNANQQKTVKKGASKGWVKGFKNLFSIK
jgi:hypothetical protein